MSDQHPYDTLSPAAVLDAVESLGFLTDGHLLALNSYENRVYQVGLEERAPLVAKFYRPRRWTDAAIEEEHSFARELADHEIPVVAPLQDDRGESLHRWEGFRFAVYPRRGGHWPELSSEQDRRRMGRFLGRIHLVAASRPFVHRPRLDIDSFGHRARETVLDSGRLPEYLIEAYASVSRDLLQGIQARFDETGPLRMLRLHGDCHPGNVLWTDAGPHFVDLDDCRMGPAIQDLWMFLSGDRREMGQQLAHLLAGYWEFADLDPVEVGLIESLRSLRILHYAAWLTRRAEDPAFRQAFPWFYLPRYWEEHILSLREQAAALQEPPLAL